LSILEITLLIITMLCGLSIIWSTLTLGISPMPSSQKARRAMMLLSDDTDLKTGEGPIFELGSGWGSLLFTLAKKYPHQEIVGYELSVIPWLSTVIMMKILGFKNVKVYRQNFLHADLNNATVIFCYLYPGGMQALEDKLNSERGRLEYLVSNNFSLPSQKLLKVIELDDLYRSPIYLYDFKEKTK
jgi:hypothetical protein